MKNRLVELSTSSYTQKQSDNSVSPLEHLLGKKIELSLKNQEPIRGVLSSYNSVSVNLYISGHSFIICRNDILKIKTI